MSGGKSPSPLASFTHNWVGGDIHGLSAAAGRCYRIAPQVTDVDTALNRQADKITRDGGWTGDAATAFRSAWGKDSQAGAQLVTAWNRIGDAIDKLAVQLAKLENALETAAAQAKDQGVSIDEATGDVQQASGGHGGSAKAADYVRLRDQAMALAKAARAGAAGELQQLTEAMLPQKGPSRTPGEINTVVGLLRGLWAVPTERRVGLSARLSSLEGNVAKTRAAIWQEQNAARDALGRFGGASDATKGAYAAAKAELAGVEGDISRLNGMENLGTKLAAGDGEGLAGLNGLGRTAVRGIPIAGSIVGGGLTIYGDRAKGESWAQAGSDGVVSSGAAYGAGALGGSVGAAAAGALGAGTLVSGGAGVLAGGVAAVGVGDFVHNAFQENWGADIHQHGVIGGIGHGIADAGVNTGHDIKNMWDDSLGKLF